MYFDRFDICSAHWMFAYLFHEGMGSNIYAKLGQLDRMGFRPSPLWRSPRDLPENAREIYKQLVVAHCGRRSTIASSSSAL